MTDKAAMRRAIRLSRRGFPAPNPHVGCVILRGGVVVGEGWHAYAGGPHAEAVALAGAGDAARGGEAFVTLEPCAHHGRTPPCADALLVAGIARVVAACADPNPRAAGGLARLAAHGVRTEVGLLREEAATANVGFLTAMRLKRPYVVVKAACSLDGRIALPSGESQWITGAAARRAAHRLRAECGAVLVGRRTVQADDPLLTARLPGVVNQPVRIVLDPHARLSGRERVFEGQLGVSTLHMVAKARHGSQIEIRLGSNGFDLHHILTLLFERGLTSLLVEGGAHTIRSFFAANLVDRVELFMAPLLLGAGPAWLEGGELGTLDGVPRLRVERVRRAGADLWISAAPLLS